MSSVEEDPYTPLFEEYRKDLHWAYDVAKERYDRLVKRTMDQQDLNEAAARSKVRSVQGPMAHDGHVIYVLRKYWLEVARLKKKIKENNPDAGWLEPLTFLVEQLEEVDEVDLVEMLSELAYWPIGINEEGAWC